MPIHVQADLTIPRPPGHVFAIAAENPARLAEFFTGFKPLIPAILEASMDGGSGLVPGALRSVRLSDGSRIKERIVAFEAPRVHDYEMAVMNPLQKLLCTNMVSAWRFEPEGEGTKVTWTYTIHEKPGRAWLARLVASRFQRAMQRCLENIARAATA
ncbi:MAG: SRPBCC family protein [Deltaproteobacteria bacterium]|nr:SRPBCC family protein [Deltaproteobacteria bacterium]